MGLVVSLVKHAQTWSSSSKGGILQLGPGKDIGFSFHCSLQGILKMCEGDAKRSMKCFKAKDAGRMQLQQRWIVMLSVGIHVAPGDGHDNVVWAMDGQMIDFRFTGKKHDQFCCEARLISSATHRWTAVGALSSLLARALLKKLV
jgi:hypothetical protein